MILEKESLYNSKSNHSENYVEGYLKAAKESINSAEVLLKENCGYDAFTLAGHSLQLAINYFCIINKTPYDKHADYSDNLEAIFVTNKKLPLTDYVYEYIGKYLTSIDYPMYGRMTEIDVNEAIEEAKKTILNIEEYCNEVLNKEKEMNKLININELKETRRTFSGNAGAKIGVIFNNKEYVVKYPKNISKMKNVEIKYSTSSLSEYIGSHIYQILGFPVHETLLGYDNDKLVVLCKNFDLENKFHEFKSVANRLRSKEIDAINFIDGNELDIKKIIDIINVSSLIKNKEEAINRFFDMFVIDYLLNNNDRNNTNWGFMFDSLNDGPVELAPIYDCGNSFNNKLSDKQILERLSYEDLFIENLVDGLSSAFEFNGHHLNFKNAFYNEEFLDLGLRDALIRNIPNIVSHFKEIEDFINSIPKRDNDIEILSPVYKEFILKSLKLRLERVLEDAYEKVK